jgi:glycosyltransferase involved in cell wall biosynthesis
LDEKIVVGFIGSLSRPSHPVDLLLHAFTRVHHAAPNSVLLLVGGGDDLDRLQSQARDLGIGESIIFTGRVPSDRVACYYHLMDVSIDPILDDDAAKGRSPLKLFESWACGVPFISSDVGDRRYLLGDPPAGLLTLPGDPDHLAHAILDVLAHPELAHHLSSLGNTRVKSYFWDKLAVRLESAYKSQPPA